LTQGNKTSCAETYVLLVVTVSFFGLQKQFQASTLGKEVLYED